MKAIAGLQRNNKMVGVTIAIFISCLATSVMAGYLLSDDDCTFRHFLLANLVAIVITGVYGLFPVFIPWGYNFHKEHQYFSVAFYATVGTTLYAVCLFLYYVLCMAINC